MLQRVGERLLDDTVGGQIDSHRERGDRSFDSELDWQACLAYLRQAEIVPRPDGEDWKAMIARISVTGTIAAIEEETFFYFLEVLPPKFQP